MNKLAVGKFTLNFKLPVTPLHRPGVVFAIPTGTIRLEVAIAFAKL